MNKILSYYIIAGETSGDQHGGMLMKELKNLNPSITFYGIGGNKMEENGLNSLYPLTELSVMGFWEVIKKLLFFKELERDILFEIKKIQPDRIILIDYPGMNLRLAKKIKKTAEIPITYYITPQVWAWKESRVETLRNYIDQRIVIFPFEKEWFAKRNVAVNFVGHPFFDEWKSGDKSKLRTKLNIKKNDTVLVLFPGSRIQELQRHLDLFTTISLLVKKKIPDLIIILGLAPNLSKKYLLNLPSDIRIESDNSQEVLECADAAIIASGTATVEAGIFNIPSVIVYKSSFISWLIAKIVIKTQFIGMANLIVDELIMPEFLQYNAKPEIIANEIISLLLEESKSVVIKRKLENIKQMLGGPGASKRAAKLILQEEDNARN